MVLYEVEELGTLTSAAYLDRLDHPSPWTSRMMPHYRGMTRGFCRVTASAGRGMGGLACVVRYEARTDRVVSLQQWLATEIGPSRPAQRGIASAHVLRAAATAPMTNEQRIRGADRAFDLALLVTGYDADALLAAAPALLAPANLQPHHASAQAHGLYGSSHALTWLEANGDSPTTRTRETGSA
jgi:hypothetical protein